MTKLNGYADHLRESLETLDEQILNARVMSRKKGKDANALQWTKTLRDLIELRNVTMEKIKGHMLGRDETGAIKEPENYWSHNQQIEFERYFKNMVTPWTLDDLKLECEDCGVNSEEVSNRHFPHGFESYEFDLCGKCYEKRTAQETPEDESTEEDKQPDQTAKPASKNDIRVILQTAALQTKILRSFPIDQRITELEKLLADPPKFAPGMESAFEAYRGVLLKELYNAKAARDHTTQTHRQEARKVM